MNTIDEIFPRVHLRDYSLELVQAWEQDFKNDDVCVSQGDIKTHEHSVDSIVSPANSFGYMTGGIDAIYVSWFGESVNENAQRAIKQHSFGELPVGSALIVDTGSDVIKKCIVAPTMRVPMIVPPINAYLSFRAALIAIVYHNRTNLGCNRINSMLCPGMGTATGKISAKDASQMMYLAYTQVKNHIIQNS
jgi:O-acetyl-ADP-ribose deacetylase (regulator of RNase III)